MTVKIYQRPFKTETKMANEPSMMQLGTLKPQFSPRLNSTSDSDQGEAMLLCSPETAVKRARLLLGCYRKGEAGDPDVFTAALVIVLQKYPESVVIAVTDPKNGVPSKQTFLPSIAEMTAACEAKMAPVYAFQRRAAADAARAAEGPVTRTPQEMGDRAGIMARMRAAYPELYGKPIAPPPEFYEEKVRVAGAEFRKTPPKVGPHLKRWIEENGPGVRAAVRSHLVDNPRVLDDRLD